MPDREPQPRDGGGELASFGEDLRREREIRGISLKEIADATKISRRFLDAIEHNDHHLLPAPVFTRGFVREYARYVGLNSEEMVSRYNHAVAADDRIEKPPEIERYPQTPVRDITPKPPRKRGIPPGYARIDRNVIALVFLVGALGAVAWWAVEYRRTSAEEPVAATRSVAPAAVDTIEPPALPSAQQPAATDGLRMSIEVIDASWVTLEADGRTVVNAELSPGERKTYEAKDAFRFRTIGNAAGLVITVNGTRLPLLGDEGQVVRNHVVDRETLLELAPERAASGDQ